MDSANSIRPSTSVQELESFLVSFRGRSVEAGIEFNLGGRVVELPTYQFNDPRDVRDSITPRVVGRRQRRSYEKGDGLFSSYSDIAQTINEIVHIVVRTLYLHVQLSPKDRGQRATAEPPVRKCVREGRQEGQLGTMENMVRTGVGWIIIEAATGIDEWTFDRLKQELDSADDGDPDAN